MSTDKFKNENSDRDLTLKNELGETVNNEQLSFNADDNSYEFDVKSDDPDYDHPDPYNTSAKNGEDAISTYDESNPYAVDEYIPNENLEMDVDKLGMHIDSTGSIVDLDPIDEVLGHTPEDDRDDLDEEGYPKNDTPK
ncbi:hypothetical protein ACFQZS_00475 [Mucilaginibacter calamicampi]|uniref:Uncharacterized protein n=1 Tax=Mucilaginibacter calamicampi TaxID=1302352 RepID=A0ABW2YQY3_9SPHI